MSNRVKKDLYYFLDGFVDKLAEEVSEKVLSTIENRINEMCTTDLSSQKLLVDSDELSSLLSVSKSTIVNLRKQGLPCLKLGDAVRFDTKEVMIFLNRKQSKI